MPKQDIFLSGACTTLATGCYYFAIDLARTWQEAWDYCRTLGADLAIINDQSEQDELVAHINSVFLECMFSVINKTYESINH